MSTPDKRELYGVIERLVTLIEHMPGDVRQAEHSFAQRLHEAERKYRLALRRRGTPPPDEQQEKDADARPMG